MKGDCNTTHDVYVCVSPSTSSCLLYISPLLLIFLSSLSLPHIHTHTLSFFLSFSLASIALFLPRSVSARAFGASDDTSRVSAQPKLQACCKKKKKRKNTKRSEEEEEEDEDDRLDYFSPAARSCDLIFGNLCRVTD